MAANKHAGKKSLAQNDFLSPGVPTSVSATDVGTSRAFNNGAATVTFTAGGGPAATSYTVTSSPGSYTATGASSPLTVTGLQSGISYTFTVTATNAAGTSAASTASSSITATTVPATPAAPSVSSPSAGSDSVTWTAPATGGKAITSYHWTSSDSKSGDTTGLSVSVSQEMGTAQTYNVYATNANGNSNTSANSVSITTTFAFFSVFSFFGVFAFFGVFGFVAYQYNFNLFNSIGSTTKVLQRSGYRNAADIEVGDELLALNLSSDQVSLIDWATTNIEDLAGELVTTTVVSKTVTAVNEFIYIDGDLFTRGHYILTRKDGVISFVPAMNVDTTYEKYVLSQRDFVPINIVDNLEIAMDKISLQCEPYDNFFTEQLLVMDMPD
jgi:hypothetical protein